MESFFPQDFPSGVQTAVVNQCVSLWEKRRADLAASATAAAVGERCRRLIDVNANSMAFMLRQSVFDIMKDAAVKN